jgi:hypothetical protein
MYPCSEWKAYVPTSCKSHKLSCKIIRKFTFKNSSTRSSSSFCIGDSPRSIVGSPTISNYSKPSQLRSSRGRKIGWTIDGFIGDSTIAYRVALQYWTPPILNHSNFERKSISNFERSKLRDTVYTLFFHWKCIWFRIVMAGSGQIALISNPRSKERLKYNLDSGDCGKVLQRDISKFSTSQ